MSESYPALSSDRAEIDPSNDALGYAPFASYLAKSIVQMTPQSGIVIGIYAPWGAGKSTLLNFVQHFVTTVYPEEEQPVVVPFNPWWFSGQEDLVLSFFQQLLSVLGKNKRVSDKVRTALEKYGDFIGQGIGTTVGLVSAAMGLPLPPGTAASAIAGGLKALAPNKPSIHEVKANVESALVDSKTKLLIIIDDIDRLTAEETRQLFRVVKAVADFPNIIYLLAFDRSVAARALESVQVGGGDAYLEKIVQVPFELPMPDSTALQKMLFNRLDAILDIEADGSSSLFEMTYWANVYREGIHPFLETPRDVVRLTNTLSVTYASVRGEVNMVDFVAIETLRVFLPEVYNLIRSNIDMFTGPEKVDGYEKEKFKNFHAKWFSEVEQKNKEPLRDMLVRLFPKTRVAWDINWIMSDSPEQWSRKRRIAHQEVFPVYFRLAPPVNDLPNNEITRMINSISDVETFADGLIRLQKTVRSDGSSLARRFLERFEDFTGDLPKDKIPTVVQGLFSVGDVLRAGEQEKSSFFDFGFHIQVTRILHQLLGRLPEVERFEILRDAMMQCEAYVTVAEEVAMLGEEHGKYEGNERNRKPTLTLEHVEELETIALNKIQSLIQIDDFKGTMNFRRLLYIWENLSSKEQVSMWLQTVTSDDDGLAKVLAQHLSQTKTEIAGNPFLQRNYRLDPFWLKPYLEPSTLRKRIEGLARRTDLTDEQRMAAIQFLQEYDDRDSGLNPESIIYTPGTTAFERYKSDGLSQS